MNDGVAPSDAIGSLDATDATTSAAETASDATDAASAEGDDGAGILDALMHTQPDLQPEQEKTKLGFGDAGTHAYIGIRKVASKLMPSSSDPGQGVPAVLNFGFAGMHFFRGDDDGDGSGTDGDGDDDDDGPQPAATGEVTAV